MTWMVAFALDRSYCCEFSKYFIEADCLSKEFIFTDVASALIPALKTPANSVLSLQFL